ncbi:hypothetical protein F5887DRAFT_938491 [Amanita rubescens]|nr:hypothetical protein F5887DRAFT_938491 [Amanita rubescens]
MFFSKSEPSNVASVKSEQPTPEQLAKFGITVRDFAYESTLPPIAPVYFLPKQIQPDPRVTRAEPSPLSLSRQLSDAAQPSGGVTRQRGFSDLRDYSPYYVDIPESPCSQGIDEYVKTPVVTPNGSLKWQDGESTGEIRPEQVVLSSSSPPALVAITTASTPPPPPSPRARPPSPGSGSRYYLRKRLGRKTNSSPARVKQEKRTCRKGRM